MLLKLICFKSDSLVEQCLYLLDLLGGNYKNHLTKRNM